MVFSRSQFPRKGDESSIRHLRDECPRGRIPERRHGDRDLAVVNLSHVFQSRRVRIVGRGHVAATRGTEGLTAWQDAVRRDGVRDSPCGRDDRFERSDRPRGWRFLGQRDRLERWTLCSLEVRSSVRRVGQEAASIRRQRREARDQNSQPVRRWLRRAAGGARPLRCRELPVGRVVMRIVLPQPDALRRFGRQPQIRPRLLACLDPRADENVQRLRLLQRPTQMNSRSGCFR